MKKILTVAITFVMVAMIAISSYATTSSELADTLYNKGSKYGMTSADKVKIERYLADNPVTDEEANNHLTFWIVIHPQGITCLCLRYLKP